MRKADTCTSCGERLIDRGGTEFPCPKCGDHQLGRCPECRDQGVEYECAGCGFVGP
ncbi:MAG: zinc finger domain-containing protein [Candidatus Thermoplasmatota archaeon]|nr:zinc finger domain-containing protein [Candidatus Thermoplasmatota archaeon]